MQRLIGGLFGMALGLFGLFLMVAPDPALSASIRERAAGFGSTLIVVGALAILGSLSGTDRLWYRKPERWRMLRGRPTRWRQWWRS